MRVDRKLDTSQEVKWILSNHWPRADGAKSTNTKEVGRNTVQTRVVLVLSILKSDLSIDGCRDSDESVHAVSRCK